MSLLEFLWIRALTCGMPLFLRIGHASPSFWDHVGAEMSGRHVLLRVNLNGRAQPVINNSESDVRLDLPAHDGRNLAIMSVTENQNMWMMENF